MLKYFDRDQFACHYAHTKEVARQFWINLGYDCIENSDKYGVDLLVEGKGRKFGCEVEMFELILDFLPSSSDSLILLIR